MLVRPSSWIYLNPSTSKRPYIFIYNSFLLAPVSPRLTIVVLAGKLLGVVRIASHGSNMGFVGESRFRSFSENWRRHGANPVVAQNRSPCFVQNRSPWRRSNTHIEIDLANHRVFSFRPAPPIGGPLVIVKLRPAPIPMTLNSG